MTRFTGLVLLILALAAFTLAPQASAARTKPTSSESIAAVVNNSAISARDVALRLHLIMSSSGLPDSPEIREKMTPQIINSLIEEQLMLQEAARLKIEVTQADIDGGFAKIAEQNKLTVQQFKDIMKNQRVSPRSLADQIRAQIAWAKVVQNRIRPDINVSTQEVDARLARLRAQQGKTQYLVSEIFLPVDDASREVDVKQLADKLTLEMASGKVPFGRVATQFSQAASSSRGGDIGWVQEGYLAQELDSVLATLKDGEVSAPIRSPAGYHILLLKKKDMLTADSLPSEDDVYNKIGQERLERAQRRYLLDLKSSAFIDRRV